MTPDECGILLRVVTLYTYKVCHLKVQKAETFIENGAVSVGRGRIFVRVFIVFRSCLSV